MGKLNVLLEGDELDIICILWIFAKFEKRVVRVETSKKNAKWTNIEVVFAFLSSVQFD